MPTYFGSFSPTNPLDLVGSIWKIVAINTVVILCYIVSIPYSHSAVQLCLRVKYHCVRWGCKDKRDECLLNMFAHFSQRLERLQSDIFHALCSISKHFLNQSRSWPNAWGWGHCGLKVYPSTWFNWTLKGLQLARRPKVYSIRVKNSN